MIWFVPFNEFAEQMAENNTQALIEALEEVMRDFNTKINEQFGDHFRQLNEAVGRINDWQEQYRQQMNELAAQFPDCGRKRGTISPVTGNYR